MTDSGIAEAALPESFAEVGVFQTSSEGFDRGLVVLAMGHPYWLMPLEGSYHLFVETNRLDEIREQLAKFEREAVGWPPVEHVPVAKGRRGAPILAFLWALAVLAVYRGQVVWPGKLETAGDVDSNAIYKGKELWRAFTALFLHADTGHLVSNLIAGVFIFSVALSTLGLLRGILMTAASAIVGNLAIAWLHFPGDYRSLGASTAIFAALGLLTGKAARSAASGSAPHPLRAILIPLGAGVGLLGLYGTGGIETDVGAHACGFLCGLVMGASLSGTADPVTSRPRES